MRLALAALAATLLPACAPAYDWREIRSTEDGYAVMLPGKPASLTRRINLDGLGVSMSMQGAKVGEVAFTVAMAALPEDSDAMRAKAVSAMREGMLRNIAGSVRETSAVSVPVVDAAGVRSGAQNALRIEAAGQAQGRAVSMSAGFVARGARAWQWVAMGPGVDAEQARTFAASFRLIEPAR